MASGPSPSPGGALPSVAIVVVNLDGAELLPACLDSLLALEYEGEWSVTVVDNGSTDGSLELLAQRYPGVEVLPQGGNTGFAAAVNTGARASGADCVALVNSDMRVDRRWLDEMVGHLDRASGTVCVAGMIVSDDGTGVDFADASLSLIGLGDQPGFGTPVSRTDVEDGRELLFACGGAMLVDREVFLSTGGFDESFFAYFEDVDFGWRLNLLGYRIVLAADARSRHLHHGTTSRFPRYQRELLIERNALATIIKNYDDAHLAEVLPAALLLLAKRGVRKGGLDRAAFDIGGSPDEEQMVGRGGLAPLVAAADVADDLAGLLARRREVQHARRRSDEELIGRFGFPLRPPMLDPEYLASQVSAVRALNLDEAFQRQRAARIVVVGGDDDPAMAGLGVAAGRLGATRMVAGADDPGCRTADVVLARPVALSARPPLPTWPVVVAVVDDEDVTELPARVDTILLLDDGLRPAWKGALDGDNAGSTLLDGTGAEALPEVVRAPWRWREARRGASWKTAATEDVNLLLDSRLSDRVEVERRLADEQHAHWLDLQVLGELKAALERRRDEVEELRAHVGSGPASLQAPPRSAARRTLQPLVRAAARARRSLRG